MSAKMLLAKFEALHADLEVLQLACLAAERREPTYMTAEETKNARANTFILLNAAKTALEQADVELRGWIRP